MVYNSRLSQEIKNFEQTVNVHELPPSFHYISHTYLRRLINEKLGVNSFAELVASYIKAVSLRKKQNEIEILSLGSGNCDFEIDLAGNNSLECRFTCYELNPHMLQRASEHASSRNLAERFGFIESDINHLKLEKQYDVIIANHSLHHFVELEHIFDEIDRAMTNKSYFVVNDMIGRNGHMFWDSTLDLCNRIWSIFPKELKYNHQLKQYFETRIQWDCSKESFEGVRAQDILPLLDTKFKFKDFAPFFAITNSFVGRDFGHNFDTQNPLHKALLDFIWQLDDYCLSNKILKPTQMMACLVKKDVPVEEYRYAYFEKATEVYNMGEKTFFEFFDTNGLLNGGQFKKKPWWKFL